jgi:hypothetical protein
VAPDAFDQQGGVLPNNDTPRRKAIAHHDHDRHAEQGPMKLPAEKTHAGNDHDRDGVELYAVVYQIANQPRQSMTASPAASGRGNEPVCRAT